MARKAVVKRGWHAFSGSVGFMNGLLILAVLG